jgi:hypothetical protein
MRQQERQPQILPLRRQDDRAGKGFEALNSAKAVIKVETFFQGLSPDRFRRVCGTTKVVP